LTTGKAKIKISTNRDDFRNDGSMAFITDMMDLRFKRHKKAGK